MSMRYTLCVFVFTVNFFADNLVLILLCLISTKKNTYMWIANDLVGIYGLSFYLKFEILLTSISFLSCSCRSNDIFLS